jgi:hypothetical protein
MASSELALIVYMNTSAEKHEHEDESWYATDIQQHVGA